ncbi:uncharacterized protein LOC143072937 [Mytilus galloprovincialis]|uniref:uncharacterized protein LOC143072937 n=1 Tax=Mytilus galloprovincialis TaxID=29158 RepID=UPI003F7C17ED
MGGGNSKKNEPEEEEDSSDFIDIEQENGSDELEIKAEEENYPAAPSEVPVQNGFHPKRAQVPIKTRKTSHAPSLTSRTSRSKQSIKTHRKEPKVNYASAIDQAMQNMSHKAETYESLMKDLVDGLETEKEKVYAITLWLSQQDIEIGKFQKFKPDTPRGYMHLIQNRRGTFPSFFAQLCRKAGMPCVIVSGYSKSASYDVGEMDDTVLKQNTNAWNVVYADKAWHIVHPFWVCRGLVGHRLGGYVKIEKGGQAIMQKETASEGQLTKCFNKYYIFTDPNEFVYRNIPVDEQAKWQLLRKPLTFDEYKHKPYVRPEFFKQKLKLISDEDCLLVAKNGICNVAFQIPPKELGFVNFTYELDMKIEEHVQDVGLGSQIILREGDENGETQINDNEGGQNIRVNVNQRNDEDENNNIKANIARYVVMMREGQKQENVSFEIRLPKQGTYKITIFAGREDEWGDDPPLVSSFRILCDNLSADVTPEMAPLDPGIVGWGPGPKSFKSGLLMPSHVRGKIEVNVKEEIIIQFQVVTKRQITVKMVHNTLKSEELKQFYSYEETYSEHSERRELTVKAHVPDKDEYAVRIGTFENTNPGHPDYVCNYLLSSKKAEREGPLVKEYRNKIKNALISNDLEEIDNLLGRAEKFKLSANEAEDEEVEENGHNYARRKQKKKQDEDVRRLQKRKEFLEMKQMFRHTLMRQNIDACERAIIKAENSQFAQVFKSETSQVIKLMDKLQSHDRWPHDIPEKNRFTLTEVSHLNAPPEKAQDVMKAICLLVFNFNDEYMDWTDTQAALKNKQNILNRMHEMQIDESKLPSKNTLVKVKRLMQSISEDTVRKIDNSLTPFYLWIKNILEKFDDIESRKMGSEKSNSVPPLQLKQ